MTATNKFKKGDSIILGNYGAGYIEKVCMEKIFDKKTKFFEIRLLSSEMRVQIPVSDIEEVGGRKPATKQKLNKIIKSYFTGKIDKTIEKDIKRRYEDGIESIDNSDVTIISEMMYYLNKKNKLKPLSVNEKKQLNQLTILFAGEYAVVNNLSFSESHDKISEKLKK